MTSLRRFALSAIVVFCSSLLIAQSKVETLNLTFMTIDVPGAGETNVAGINSNGDMVGWYSQAFNTPSSGFLLSGGTFTYLNYPGGYDTEATGITDAGLIVGNAYTSSEGAAGFTYQGGVFNTIQIKGYPDTYAQGINSAGVVVGGYGFGSSQGFEQFGTKFKNVTPPGSYGSVSATGINKLGQIVGWTYGASANGFFYQRGKFQTLSVPGSQAFTEAWGINDNGIVVGTYFGCTPSCTYHGFVLMRGKYFSFDVPGSLETFALGVGPSGQIVGTWADSQNCHGFVSSPISAEYFAARAGADH